jgi:branched-chain amino acid transport system substrate-binding protein
MKQWMGLGKPRRQGGGVPLRSSVHLRMRPPIPLTLAALMLSAATLSVGDSSYAASSHVVLTASPSPVKVGAIVSTNSPLLSIPSIPASIRAAVRNINSHGGLDGHRVVFDYCNDQVNPTVAAQCANKMVTDHVIATVGNFSLFGAAIVPVLDSAGIPQIASEPLVQQQYTSPKSFLIDPGGYGYANSSMIAAHQAGVKKIAIVYVAGAGLGSAIASGVKKATSLGMQVVAQIPVSPVATDLDSTVQAVTSSGADAAYIVLTTPGSVAFIQSYGTQAAKYKVFLAAAQLTTGTIKQVSATSGTMYGVKLVGAVLPFSSAAQVPQLRQYAKEMAAEAKSGDAAAQPSQWGQNGLQAWTSMHVLAETLKKVGTKPLTADAVTNAMNAARNLATGVMPPWTPSKAGPPGLPRVSNPYMYVESVKNGVVVLAQKKPINSFSG